MEITSLPIEYLQRSRLHRGKALPRLSATTLGAVKRHGIITPVVARPIPDQVPERYEILCGESRWLAAQRVGLHEIPVHIRRDLSDAEAEDIVRQGLQSGGARLLEEAAAAKRLVEQGLTITEVAKRTGRTRTALSHLLRLLTLSQPVKDLLREGSLTYGQARPLVGLSAYEQLRLATRLVQHRLSAREAERLARHQKTPGALEAFHLSEKGKDPDVLTLEQALTEHTGSPVTIAYDAQGRGQLVVEFASLDILQGILERLGYQE